MGDTEFTPGPWKSNNLDLAKTKFHQKVGPAIIKNEISIHGANLMKASPDMFEVLDSLENDNGSIPEFLWEMRNKALAKARGK